MRWIVLAVMLLTALGGCADDSQPEAADDTFDGFDDEVAAGLGLIRGVVVDTTITPIEGVTVAIKGTELSAETNVDGAFQFNDLEPGAYFLDVSKPGYQSIQSQATVEADVAAPDILRIQIEAAPGTEPRAETVTLEGFIQCGWGTPTHLGTCPGLDDEDRSELIFPFTGSPAFVQTEVDWESTQPAGKQLYLIVAVCDAPCEYNMGDRIVNEVRDSPSIDRATAGNRTSGEVGIIGSAGGPANGTGVALDQSFMAYVTFFYNIAEPDADWTFLEDGDYEV